MTLADALQAVAAFVIVQLTITSADLEEIVRQGSVKFLLPFASSIVPAAVSLLNAVQPPVIRLIAAFERWDDGGAYTKWMVWRLFISKLLNVMIQVRYRARDGSWLVYRTLPR